MSEKESLSKKELKEKKTLDKMTAKALKKNEFLKKMKRANLMNKLRLYTVQHFWTLFLLQIITIFMVGIFGGIMARIIWEIWKTIFSVNL